MSWIKVRTNLASDPRVRTMADSLRVPASHVVGALVVVWSYADEHSTDGLIRFTTPVEINHLSGLPGLCDAMRAVGWLDWNDDGVRIPRFDTHNGTTAKARAQGSARVSAHRASADAAGCNGGPLQGCNGEALQGVTVDRYRVKRSGVTRGEESREEKREERESARERGARARARGNGGAL